MNKLPVSVVITTFNSEKTILPAIRSVLLQSKQAGEILVSDNGSDDLTVSIVEHLQNQFSNIRLVRCLDKKGAAANRDFGIRSACYPVVTHLDADDLFFPEKIEREYRSLICQRSVAYSSIVNFSPLLSECSLIKFDVAMDDLIDTRALMSRKYGVPRDMMFHKSLYEAVGGFDLELDMFEDLDFKIKLADFGANYRFSGSLGTLYYASNGSLSRSDDKLKADCLERVKAKNNLQEIKPYKLAMGEVFKRRFSYLTHYKSVRRLFNSVNS